MHRALKVGALHDILPPRDLRPYLIHAVERGVLAEEQSWLPKAAATDLGMARKEADSVA